MTEIKRNGNRILAVLIMLVVLWSVNPAASHAALSSGKNGSAAFEYLGKSKDGSYYYDKANNERLPEFQVKINGVNYVGYCMNNGKGFYDNQPYTSKMYSAADAWKELSTAEKRTLTLIMVYGYNKGKSAPYGNVKDYYAATQALVWEAAEGKEIVSVSGTWTSKDNAFDDMISGRNYGKKNYDWIKKKITAHLKGASFTKRTKAGAKTYTMKYNYGTETFSATLTDSNRGNTYKKAEFTRGLSMRRASYDYTFSATKEGTYAAELKNNISTGTDQPLLILQPAATEEQSIILGATDDTQYYVKLKTEGAGTAQIRKTSDNGKVAGFTFHVKCDDNEYDASHVTDDTGIIALDLYPGTYTVTEILTEAQKEEGYVAPAAQKVKVKEGSTSVVTMHNKFEPPSVGVKIIKTTTDGGSVEGFHFQIKGDCGDYQYEGEGVTDIDGYIVKEDLQPGVYTITEVMTEQQKLRYHEPRSQTVTLTGEEEEAVEVYFENIHIEPEINTQARDGENGTQISEADERVELIDTVEYRNLHAGEKYLLQASLVRKDGTPVYDMDGNEVMAELMLMPSESSGTVDVALPAFDGTQLAEQQVVIFENLYLYETRQLLVEHADLENRHQTISLVKEEPVPMKKKTGKAEPEESVETDDDSRTTMYLCIMIMVTAVITALCCAALREGASPQKTVPGQCRRR